MEFPTSPHHGAWRPWLVALFFSIFFAVAYHSGTWESGDEDRYYTLAQAIHRGLGFVNAEHPEHAPESITPPGYPALLASAMVPLGENPQRLKWTGATFLVLTLMPVFGICRLLWPGRPVYQWSNWLLGTGAVSMLAFSGMLMADLPAMAFMCLALVAYVRTNTPITPRRALLVGLLIGFAYLCRAASVALAGAILLDLLLRRSWRPFAACAAGLAAVAAPWWFRNTVLLHVPDQYIRYALDGSASEGHSGLLTMLVQETVRDLPVFLKNVPRQHFYQLFDGDFILARVGLGALAGPGIFLFLAIAAAGWIHRLRRPAALEYFVPAHFLLISAYPRPFHDTNYLFPVLPFTAFYFIHALQTAGAALDRRRPAWRAPIIAAAAVSLCAAYSSATAVAAGLVHARGEWARRNYGPWEADRYRSQGGSAYEDWIRYAEAGSWIRSNTSPNTLVASRKPKHTFVFSDRRGWRYDLPHEVGCSNAWEALIKYTNVVFIEDGFATSRTTFNAYGNARVDVLLPLMEAHRERIELLHETPPPATRIWRIRSAPAETTRER